MINPAFGFLILFHATTAEETNKGLVDLLGVPLFGASSLGESSASGRAEEDFENRRSTDNHVGGR